jgi:hypothetical protein
MTGRSSICRTSADLDFATIDGLAYWSSNCIRKDYGRIFSSLIFTSSLVVTKVALFKKA